MSLLRLTLDWEATARDAILQQLNNEGQKWINLIASG
jgi:hypothetical protein